MSVVNHPDYKGPELPSIQSIPNDWTVKPVKAIAELINGYPFESSRFNPNEGHPIVRIRDFGKTVVETRYLGDFLPEASIDNQDVLIGMDGDFNVGRWLGETPALLNQRVCCVRAKSLSLTRYLEYALLAPLKQINEVTYATTVKHLSSHDVLKIKVSLPLIEEEIEKVVSFLDSETAKIDALIAEQERLIKLLQEKRQTVISHAITKGLNPNAPMKDSGVEWLGEVPRHWTVMKMKNLVEVKDGTHATPDYVEQAKGSFPLITSKDFIDDEINFEEAKYISTEDHAEIIKRSNTEKSDVLMSMIGGNIGKALIVETDQEFSIKNVALFKTRGNILTSKLILYYLRSGLLEIQIKLVNRGGAQAFLGLGDIRNLVLPQIPEDEIKALIQHLDAHIGHLNQLIAIAFDFVSLLEERRSALISAAVTGQIDVRGLVPEEEAA